MRGPDERATKIDVGHECWSSVAPAKVLEIAEARYAQGAARAELEELARSYPPPEYWWIIEHGY